MLPASMFAPRTSGSVGKARTGATFGTWPPLASKLEPFRDAQSKREQQLSKLFAAAIVFLVPLALLGCAGEGIPLTPEDTALPACEGVDRVTVETLADRVPEVCDLGNVTLEFPDGFTTLAPFIGSSAASGSAVTPPNIPITYSMWNIGIDGVVAARTQPGGSSTEWWGSPQGIKRVQDAFGTEVPSIME